MTSFRHLPVLDLTAVTHNFEQLQGLLSEQERELRFLRAKEAPKLPELWKGAEALGFKNEWKNLEAGNKAEYRKNPFGTVELRGVIASGKEGLGAFTLPAGYRPKSICDFIVVANINTGIVEVMTNGEVIPIKLGGETKVNTVLNPVFFSVE